MQPPLVDGYQCSKCVIHLVFPVSRYKSLIILFVIVKLKSHSMIYEFDSRSSKTSRLGNRAGKTVGSGSVSSKFGIKSTVFFPISRSISPAIADSRAYYFAAGLPYCLETVNSLH